ncbi:reverse transcriptase family protein [Pseudonocardia nematodicida]|uniref:RNA-directed DNA polymerase n=1 Tax=Pseudonocardia nematodicida TaxID=1206997 RepID=A0ABV1KGI6_9PSEU
MAPSASVVAALARPGRWDPVALAERLAAAPGWSGPDEIGDVAGKLLGRWRSTPRAPADRFEQQVAALPALPRRHLRDEAPPPARWRWPVEPWTDVPAVARALHLDDGELAWFADPGGWLRHISGPLTHYRRRWVPARSGTPRLIESPAPRLAELQRRVVRRVLAAIPVHDAAHGYVRGRGPHTLARIHSGRPMLLRLDLEGFFSHVTGARLAGLLEAAGYPPAVARTLAGLLVTATPPAVLRGCPATAAGADPDPRRRLLDRLAAPHLPQGAPSSPVAANLLAHRLDRRLAGLATAVGARYGRYADDLVFSGDADLPVHGLIARITTVAAEEGFRVRPGKTRIAPAQHRQRVTGLIVNSTAPAPSRRDYDELRALLHNAARTGPDAQNRDGNPAFREHLLGRIAWVGSGRPRRAATLHGLFDRIGWDRRR